MIRKAFIYIGVAGLIAVVGSLAYGGGKLNVLIGETFGHWYALLLPLAFIAIGYFMDRQDANSDQEETDLD